MRISYSQYSAFNQNPERYRLRYGLGLTPDGDETPGRYNLSRRRGRCFHELYEARSKGTLDKDRSLIAHEYGLDLVERCEDMIAVVPDLGTLSHVEESFELPLGDGKHSIIGRIDHAFGELDNDLSPFTIGDFKTTKGTRTKKELSEYLGTMQTSSQSKFYLKAARALGYGTELFTYHVILDRKDKQSKPQYLPLELPPAGPCEVDREMDCVYSACEQIEFLKNEYGVYRPWSHANCWPCTGDQAMCGYAGICKRVLIKGAEPDGFTSRYKEQLLSEDEAQ